MKRAGKRMIALVAVALLAWPLRAADMQRIFKSSVFPGMGQLADGQIGWGLGFMAGEAVWLSLMFGQMAKSSAYALETRRDSILYIMGGDYLQVKSIYERWQRAYDRSNRSRVLAFVFGGCAVGWWALNVVHAALLGPTESSQPQLSLASLLLRRTEMTLTEGGAGVECTLEF